MSLVFYDNKMKQIALALWLLVFLSLGFKMLVKSEEVREIHEKMNILSETIAKWWKG